MKKSLMEIDEIITLSFEEFKHRCKICQLDCLEITKIEWGAFVNAVCDILTLKYQDADFYRILSIIYSHMIGYACVSNYKKITFKTILQLVDEALDLVSSYSNYKFEHKDCEKIKQLMLSYIKYGGIIDFNEYYKKEDASYEVSDNNKCIVYNFNDYYQKRK